MYPDLNPSAPQELQANWLKKLTEVEAFFLDEIKDRRRQVIKQKRLNTVICIVGHGFNYISINC